MTDHNGHVIQFPSDYPLPPCEPRDPEAVAIIAGDCAQSIRRIEAGTTDWQWSVDRKLALIINELSTLKYAQVVWPKLATLAAIVFGCALGFCTGTLIVLSLYRH
jgi:hypothetical protein